MRSIKSRLVATAIVALLVASAPQPASAAGCTAVITASAKGYSTLIKAQLLLIQAAFDLGYNNIKKALTLLANDISNTAQARNNTRLALNDKETGNMLATSATAQRNKLVKQFTPSAVSCGEATRQRSLGNSYAHYAATRGGLNDYFTDLAMNKKGGPTEKGSLQYSAYLWNERCSKYMDADEVSPPASLKCTGGTGDMKDLDMRVQDSLLEPLNIDDPKKLDAAKATILLLTDVDGTDPLRGPALGNSAGQTQFVSYMRQKARMAVARDALSRILAMRTTSDTAEYDGTKNSRYARYAELVTGQKATGNTLSGVLPDVALAGEQENAGKQALASRLVSQKMLLTEFLRMTEQMVAVESVRLSMELEASAIHTPVKTSFSTK